MRYAACGMGYALCVMRYTVQYAACVIPLMRNAASFSFFFSAEPSSE